jgi:tetratricopeptide (TPR) repeat protein
MKRNLHIVQLCLLFAAVILSYQGMAQKKQPDMEEVRQQMKAAQHVLDSVKEANPGMVPPGITLPQGVSIPKLPDIDKLGKDIDENMSKVKSYSAEAKQKRDKSLPVSNTASAFSTVPNPGKALIVRYATDMMDGALVAMKKIDPNLQQVLDELAKNPKITPQAQGMLMLCDNVPKSVVQYMICKGVLLTPDNPWAINDLGIIFRNEKQNKEAAQCFKYAFSFNDTFQIIKCNLAWAVAYYGDFITAKKYFHEIVDRLPNYSEAWEGLGMIAYQEGDLATLFKCLAAQVKNVGGGGDGPSDSFTSFCGGVIDEQRINNIGKPK